MTRAQRLKWRGQLVDRALAAARQYRVAKPLTVELVPSPCWWMNLRTILPGAEWDALRIAVGEAANRRCELCGEVGPRHPVEVHEVWEWKAAGGTSEQRLRRLVALCPPCHVVKHAGRAQLLGFGGDVVSQLQRVNAWDDDACPHARGFRGVPGS